MSRLTLEELELLDTTSAYNTMQHKAICGQATLELIEYKKIEEELGVDLISLIHTLKDNFAFKALRELITLVDDRCATSYDTGYGICI